MPVREEFGKFCCAVVVPLGVVPVVLVPVAGQFMRRFVGALLPLGFGLALGWGYIVVGLVPGAPGAVCALAMTPVRSVAASTVV